MTFTVPGVNLYMAERFLEELNYLGFAFETFVVFAQDIGRCLGDKIWIAELLLRPCHFFLKQHVLLDDIVFGLLKVRVLHGCSHLD